MIRRNVLIAAVIMMGLGAFAPPQASAQRLYTGSSSGDAQYSGSTSIDSYGRAVNADGRYLDRFGHPIDDYGRPAVGYRLPSHSASGLYYPGGYSGLGYSSGIGYSVGIGGYSGGYYSQSGRFGSGVSAGVTYVAPPRTIVVGGVYPSRTVMNNSTRGGVVEYTNNGNGYIYSPGTSSQTVISSGPSIFPSMTVVQPSQPPVIIQTRPLQTVAKTFSGSSPVGGGVTAGQIVLICSKDATAPLTYVLNGTAYTIKPGYSQSFADDRNWTIEFLRGGSGSQPVRYDLRAGTYQFLADENGWDLKSTQTVSRAPSELPPSPVPPLSTTPDPIPAPTPSPDL